MTFQFDSLHSFIQMAGHGVYVWSVVAITLLVMAALVVWPLWAHRQGLAEQQRLARIEKARRAQRANQSIEEV